ncbi:MAG: hypothetical protein ACK56W_18220 [Pirellula sp.]|jgi:hypothetical protein|nr:hypothetical protein [Pirellula sp.]
MKLTGVSYDVEGLEEYTYVITEAVMTDKRISMDWEESGYVYNAIMNSEDGGTYYVGTFGSPRPESSCHIEARRFRAKSGEELLWLKWNREDTGYEGVAIVHLASEWES